MSDHDSSSFLWFLAGLGVGAVVGVLYAPRAGDETRQVIRDKAEEGRDYMRERAKGVREQAEEWVDRGREILNQQREQFKAAVDAGRQAYHESTTPESGGPKNI